ncbi:hypothetical protein SKAU_G00165730 [Synaphobranchus kaupii]|uniref:non-specific serine/threonine protein kinase n=1 Tax=Synaphobranchus kaupii TaxID=118154 RepID=A0A9Q1IZV7_SYNKA|nr:hypothetical protein SKAU_G00165730 [Synaphobranchus kaupii]
MDVQNYVPRLNEFAQRSHLNLKYEVVCTDGPDHCRTFTMKVVMDGKVYPDGVGRNKKEAKQRAAKKVLDAIHGESVQQNDCNHMTSPPECPTPRPATGSITQPNYVCWLNEHSHKTRVTCKPIESTQIGPPNTAQSCRYVVDGKEFPEAFAGTKKEAKELAAKAVYEELMRESNKEAVDESQTGDATGQVEVLSRSVSGVSLGSSNRSPAAEMPSMKYNYGAILNNYCQTTARVCEYKFVERKGPSHLPLFVYKVAIGEKEYPKGQGKSTKEAKQHAAQLAWDAIQEQSDWDSQVSCRATVTDGSTSPSSSVRDSEDNAETNNKAESASIIFKDSASINSPKMARNSGDIKPKIKLAPHFSMGNNNIMESDVLKNNTKRKLPEKTTQPTDSLFLKEYDSIKAIGKGGYGHVYKARKKIEDKYVAVKIVKSTKKALREVSALSDLQHPNIVRYYHAWIEDTRYQDEPSDSSSSSHTSDSDSPVKFMYIQMELCDRDTLKAWISERNNTNQEIRNEKALDILKQVVKGVGYIHSEKLIHRDLKPANILFASDGRVKIGDFGLVTSAESDSDEALLERTKRTGTKSYMSPEQMNQCTYDKEVDIFALGLISFELLWKLTTQSERLTIWNDVRTRRFPQEFYVMHSTEHKLIERMLSEKPEDRPDAPAIASELDKFTNIKKDQHALQEMKTI